MFHNPDNTSRELLVLKLACTACGKPLKLSYDLKNKNPYAENEPTGADMVQTTIGVEPCKCITTRIEEMRNAARLLFKESAQIAI